MPCLVSQHYLLVILFLSRLLSWVLLKAWHCQVWTVENIHSTFWKVIKMGWNVISLLYYWGFTRLTRNCNHSHSQSNLPDNFKADVCGITQVVHYCSAAGWKNTALQRDFSQVRQTACFCMRQSFRSPLEAQGGRAATLSSSITASDVSRATCSLTVVPARAGMRREGQAEEWWGESAPEISRRLRSGRRSYNNKKRLPYTSACRETGRFQGLGLWTQYFQI